MMEAPTDLIDRYAEQSLTPAEFDALARWIQSSDEAARQFTRRLALYAHLQAYLSAGAAPHSGDTAGEVPPAAPQSLLARMVHRPTPFSYAVAAAVVGLLIAAMALVAVPVVRVAMGPADRDGLKTVAQITGMNNVRWAAGDAGRQLHTFLLDGQEVELQSGLVELTFHSGAVVVVEGPARVRLLNENGLHLAAGQLAAKVPLKARGFAVQTAAAKFVDLGTEFAVSVDASQSATMYVSQGQVAYEPTSGGQRVIVAARHGVVIHRDGVVQAVAAKPRTFANLARGVGVENLVVDGSFEQFGELERIPRTVAEDGNRWRSFGVEEVLVVRGQAAHGECFLQFTGEPHPGAAIEQQINTVPGHRYALTFRLARNTQQNTPTMNVVVCTAAAAEAAGNERALANLDTPVTWQPFEFRTVVLRFVAHGEWTTIRFSESLFSNSRSVGPLIDDVRVVPAPTWAPAAALE